MWPLYQRGSILQPMVSFTIAILAQIWMFNLFFIILLSKQESFLGWGHMMLIPLTSVLKGWVIYEGPILFHESRWSRSLVKNKGFFSIWESLKLHQIALEEKHSNASPVIYSYLVTAKKKWLLWQNRNTNTCMDCIFRSASKMWLMCMIGTAIGRRTKIQHWGSSTGWESSTGWGLLGPVPKGGEKIISIRNVSSTIHNY